MGFFSLLLLLQVETTHQLLLILQERGREKKQRFLERWWVVMIWDLSQCCLYSYSHCYYYWLQQLFFFEILHAPIFFPQVFTITLLSFFLPFCHFPLLLFLDRVEFLKIDTFVLCLLPSLAGWRCWNEYFLLFPWSEQLQIYTNCLKLLGGIIKKD